MIALAGQMSLPLLQAKGPWPRRPRETRTTLRKTPGQRLATRWLCCQNRLLILPSGR
jgi:hypothetical protein